jgi:putative transport protein
MEINLQELLSNNTILLLFCVIGFGYLIGNIKIGSIQVGSTTGVLLAGLMAGHIGFPDAPGAGTFGFILFIFSVGLQAGPSFFSVFLADGKKYVLLSVVVALSSVGLAILFSRLLNLDYGMNAGLLAGALTSTPTLAGAEDAIKSGLAELPQGVTAEQASTNVTVAYALTYIFGTAGLILFIRYLPVILRIDLPAEARKLEIERGLGRRQRKRSKGEDMPIIRAYEVRTEKIAGHTLEEIHVQEGKHFKVLRIRRGNEIIDPEPEFQVQKGDIVSIIARISDVQRVQEQVGGEILDPELLNYHIKSREIVVVNPWATGKSIKDLHITHNYGCFPVGITRSGIDLSLDDNMTLNKGDVLQVIGESLQMAELAENIGYIEQDIEETDLLTFAFGIVAGVMLGMVVVKLRNVSIGLGSAGGLLLIGILIGFMRSLHPTFGRIPAAARYILMELGLTMFMASVGLKAGGGIGEALGSVGLILIVAGIFLTLTPVLIAYAFGRLVLKLNPALLLGSIAGAMTSTPALNIVTTEAKSSVPALGYAGTYTFANVFLTFAGSIMMM